MTGFPDFTQKKKKSGKSIWLWLVMLGLFFAVVMFGQTVLIPQETTTTKAPATAELADTPTDTVAPTPDSFLPDYQSTLDPNVDAATPSDTSFLQTAIDVGWKLGIVIALMYGLLIGLRWLQQFKNPVKGTGATIQVLETIGLAPGRSLHLIVVGEKTLLLGSTEQNIGLLTELADAHLPLPEEEPVPEEELPFEQSLAVAEAVSVELSESTRPEPAAFGWQNTLDALRNNVQNMRDSVRAE